MYQKYTSTFDPSTSVKVGNTRNVGSENTPRDVQQELRYVMSIMF